LEEQPALEEMRNNVWNRALASRDGIGYCWLASVLYSIE